MPAEEVNDLSQSVARGDRRIARRDRTKSPHLKVTGATESNGSMNENNSSSKGSTEGESSSEGGKPERRKSSNYNLTASSLLEKVKESSAPSITRLRRTNTTDGGTREGIRMLSQGHARANGRRVHDGNEALALHMSMDGLNFDPKDMDASGMSNSNGMSQSRGGRRKPPARTRSMQDYPPRGHPGTQRAPRARRKPGRSEEEPTEGNTNEKNTVDNSGAVRRPNTMDSSSMRRKPPPRSRSAHDPGPVPPRGAHQRMARPGRRKQGREVSDDDEETVLISDSDDEEPKHNSMDRSMPAMGSSHNLSRRRPLQRTRSAQESCLPRGHSGYQRPTRAARRRQSNDKGTSGEEAPARRGAGSAPGLRRCNTGTPPTSGSGPGLMRSNTNQMSRSNRTRGGRNTTKELARVANSKSRETSPNDGGDPSRSPSPGIETEALSANRASNSPVRSRQARRRLREDRKREDLERSLEGSAERDEPKPKQDKKDDPVWMRRLKKNVVKSNDDSFVFDETAAHLDRSISSENNNSGTRTGGGSSLPRMGENEDFFHTDPSFGIFPVSQADAMYQSPMPETRKSLNLDEKQLKKEQKGAMMEMAGDKAKMDFSTIS